MKTDNNAVKIRLEIITLSANKLTELLAKGNLFNEELHYEVDWIVETAMKSKGFMPDANPEFKSKLVKCFKILLDTYDKM